MALSDAQWLAWLKQTDKKPTALISANYFDVSAGTTKTLSLSNFGYIDPFNSSAINYKPVMISDIVISLDAYTTTMDSFDFLVEDVTLFDDAWIGNTVTILYGDKSWPVGDFRQIYIGKIKSLDRLQNNFGRLYIDDSVKDSYLEQIVDISDYGYTGLFPIDYPFMIGKNGFNIRPIRVNSTTYRIYAISPLGNTLVVRKNGVTQTSPGNYSFNSTGLSFGGLNIVFTSTPATTDEITIDLSCDYETVSAIFNIVGNTAGKIVDNLIPNTWSGIPVNPDAAYVWYGPESFSKFAKYCFDSVLGHARLNARGQIQPFVLQAPSSPTRAIGDSEIIGNSVYQVEKSQPWARFTLGWAKNFYPQSGRLDSSVSEANARKFQQDYSYSLVTRTVTGYPLPESIERQTIITDSTDMIALQEFQFGLHDSEWTTIEFQTVYTGIYDDVGDTITLKTSDFGLSAGDDFVIIQNDINLNTGICTQKAWRKD